jgi:signal transduction histidine kinase
MLNTDTMMAPPAALDPNRIDRALRHQRHSIGRELHDNIGQQLTGLGMLASSVLGSIAEDNRDARASVDLLVDGLRQALSDVRSLSHSLADLDEAGAGLAERLDRIARHTRLRAPIECRFDRKGDADVEEPRTVRHLVRIAQEAIQNALRHAGPSVIRIGLGRDENRIRLEVHDDGRGLPATEVPRGAGITNMQRRARAIGADLEIRSGGHKGTTVRCTIREEQK